jgi:hypothetical protein
MIRECPPKAKARWDPVILLVEFAVLTLISLQDSLPRLALGAALSLGRGW